jgi:hypothetical protein
MALVYDIADSDTHGVIFAAGADVGALEAVVASCEVPLTIEPTAWACGGDKETSRQRALQLFLAAHALLARKMDHGRAESALLAVYGARILGAAQ